MFIPLLWKELINFSPNIAYAKRPIIIVELDDNLGKRYNAIVVKYDKAKNVHVRYLNNPFYKNRHWWTGNSDNKPGLNCLTYHARFLGDDFDEMEGLCPDDFVEDGYDDIINYEKEPHRFFKAVDNYPFLAGLQGNVHVDNYYLSIYKSELSRDAIPECIERYAGVGQYRHRIGSQNNDVIELVMNVLETDFCPLVADYQKYRGNQLAETQIIITFKKYLALLMSHQFIRKYKSVSELGEDRLKIIKEELQKGYQIADLIQLLPYLIGKQIVLFDCLDTDMEINVYGKELVEDGKKKIFFLKYNGRLELLK